MTFEKDATRRELDGFLGYRRMLSYDFEEFRRGGALASCSHGYLNMAVSCLLVDYDEPARALLQRAEEWLLTAIRENERPKVYARFGLEANRYLSLGQARWLLRGEQDAESFRAFVENKDRFLAELHPSKTEISLSAPSYLDALAYREAIRMLDLYGSRPPASLTSIRGEAQMCYAICQHELEGLYSDVELREAADRFLRKNVEAWLTKGHPLRAAEWMKIVHWKAGTGTLQPKDVVHQVYSYLTGEATR